MTARLGPFHDKVIVKYFFYLFKILIFIGFNSLFDVKPYGINQDFKIIFLVPQLLESIFQ